MERPCFGGFVSCKGVSFHFAWRRTFRVGVQPCYSLRQFYSHPQFLFSEFAHFDFEPADNSKINKTSFPLLAAWGQFEISFTRKWQESGTPKCTSCAPCLGSNGFLQPRGQSNRFQCHGRRRVHLLSKERDGHDSASREVQCF